jgi:hypothetical protein
MTIASQALASKEGPPGPRENRPGGAKTNYGAPLSTLAQTRQARRPVCSQGGGSGCAGHEQVKPSSVNQADLDGVFFPQRDSTRRPQETFPALESAKIIANTGRSAGA